MDKLEFKLHRVPARKDLLHFVEENLDSNVYEKLGKDPDRWVEELNIIHGLLTGQSLTAGIDLIQPPQDDPEFKKLGDRAFLYRGDKREYIGLWVSEQKTRFDLSKNADVPYTSWTNYRVGGYGTLNINPKYDDLDYELFLPENFEKKSKIVKQGNRQIFNFDIQTINVYAKSCYIEISKLYEPPSYRLTSVSRINKVTSKQEMERFLKLAEHGVDVPEVLAYYEGPVEEFLFSKRVEGQEPSKFIETHRNEIIKQDAEMLAVLCLFGYRKVGFTDFDDKIFDGENLYLIDVDELRDLYCPVSYNFRQMLLNPSNKTELNEFRKAQKDRFVIALRDTIYMYKDSLTPDTESKSLYVKHFYQRIGLQEPNESELKDLIEFSDDYMTWDSYMFMMTEE